MAEASTTIFASISLFLNKLPTTKKKYINLKSKEIKGWSTELLSRIFLEDEEYRDIFSKSALMQ